MQDVLDWVEWFKPCRSPDITVGITRIRQLTFQMRSKDQQPKGANKSGQSPGDPVPGAGAAAAAGGGAAAEGPPVQESQQQIGSACCIGFQFLDQLLALPKNAKTSIQNALTPWGLAIPPALHSGRFTGSYRGAKNGRSAEQPFDPSALEFKLTYKTSMWVDVCVSSLNIDFVQCN